VRERPLPGFDRPLHRQSFRTIGVSPGNGAAGDGYPGDEEFHLAVTDLLAASVSERPPPIEAVGG
jgi:hypothetical protein